MQTSVRPEGSGESARQDLPFTLKDVKAAIPEYCFQPSAFRSLAYFFLDIGIIAGLYAIAAYIDSWLFYPIFWFAQGTMFWALFVVGHDCGHGSFSKSKLLNNIIGHLSHAPILVPFHGWRISHRTHHSNTGNIDTDESWYPINESKYDEMSFPEKLVRFYAPLIAYPVYLFKRSPSRAGGSHFVPSSPLFKPSEKNDILVSTASLLAMVAFLGWFTLQFGAIAFFKFYFVPYAIFVVWLDLVTYLHHTEDDIPWYRGDNWYYLKGALSTIDRDYGIFNNIHHNIGTHVVHHIFHTIPHYHLKDATEAVKPLLGDYYRVSHEPILKSFFKSQKACHYVPDTGAEVYYKPSK
ncbi:fatty acid desaturase [[Limnothrix rosea] IAM M-220]|uniref:fatty acid desaturase n=1 Tax=[Limnothrix rosea] IAM M-220 TaxID=454133 RepID=UPI000965B0CD|nr:fatty acid desaturase [[Limnothrix rosea] IAM M-220]OKH19271.1 fatty acid desaturase [[Limnothrix rosea] IAM M-220]